jgi:hypothetical protein
MNHQKRFHSFNESFSPFKGIFLPRPGLLWGNTIFLEKSEFVNINEIPNNVSYDEDELMNCIGGNEIHEINVLDQKHILPKISFTKAWELEEI